MTLEKYFLGGEPLKVFHALQNYIRYDITLLKLVYTLNTVRYAYHKVTIYASYYVAI